MARRTAVPGLYSQIEVSDIGNVVAAGQLHFDVMIIDLNESCANLTFILGFLQMSAKQCQPISDYYAVILYKTPANSNAAIRNGCAMNRLMENIAHIHSVPSFVIEPNANLPKLRLARNENYVHILAFDDNIDSLNKIFPNIGARDLTLVMLAVESHRILNITNTVTKTFKMHRIAYGKMFIVNQSQLNLMFMKNICELQSFTSGLETMRLIAPSTRTTIHSTDIKVFFRFAPPSVTVVLNAAESLILINLHGYTLDTLLDRLNVNASLHTNVDPAYLYDFYGNYTRFRKIQPFFKIIYTKTLISHFNCTYV